MKSVRVVAAALLALFLVAPFAFGDKLYLKNGNTLEGKVVREDATNYYVKVKGMGEMPIPKASVLKIEKTKSVFDDYTEKRKALKADDAEGHYKLGLWCKENSMRRESEAEFRAAIEANPDHAGARAELGFVKYEGEWMTKERRDKILADIAKKEDEILAGLKLGDAVKNPEARFTFRPPAGFKVKGDPAKETDLYFTGPVLGKAPVTIEFQAAAAGDSLDDFAKLVSKIVDREHEGAQQQEPKPAKLAGNDGRELTFTYTRSDVAPEDLDMERHEILAATVAGNFRFMLECRAGYYDRLKSFFGQVTGSFGILQKAPDFVSKEAGFSLAFPDDSYKKVANTFFKGPNGENLFPQVKVTIGNENARVLLMVFAGKKGDGAADTTSLKTLRDSLVNTCIVTGFVQAAGSEREAKVDGADALIGNIRIVGGRIGGGRFCVFVKGDRYFRILFLNIGNMMGEKYVDEDLNKLLAGFKVLD